MMKKLIIIPAYNESENIVKTVDAIKENAKGFDYVIINDCSTDKTRDICEENHFNIINLPINLGIGGAVQTGYRYAYEEGYDIAVQVDGDGQHDVCNIPVIYQRLKEPDADGKCPDIVLGARFREGSSDFPVSKPKKIVYSMFRFLIRMTTKNRISDPTTGLQGLSRKAFLYYSKYNHFDDKYPDANMIIMMLLTGFRVVEVPAVMHARTAGKSMHSGLKPFWYMLRVIYSVIIILFQVKILKKDAGVGLKSADKI